MKVLITGARTPAALELVRAFAGSRVFTADTFRFCLAGASKWVERHFVISAETLAREVASLHRAHQFELIIPTGEEVFYLADRGLPLFAPTLGLLRRLHSKWEFQDLVKRAGGLTPRSRLLRRPEQLPNSPQGYVFKPEFCRFGSATRIETFTGVRPTESEPWLAQERIEGQELCSYAVAIAGRLTAFSCYRPRYRLPGSSAILFQPVEDAGALELVSRLVAQLQFTGQLAFDLIRSGADLYAIDCNPRSTSGIHLLGPGLARSFLERDFNCPRTWRSRVFGVAMPLLVGHYPLPSLLNDWSNALEVTWTREDPKPWWALFPHLVETLWRCRRGLTFQQASTGDTEWDGSPLGRPSAPDSPKD